MKIAVLGSKTLPAFAGADRVAENILTHLPDDGSEYTIYIVQTPDQQEPFDYAPHIHVIPIPCLSGKHSKATTFCIRSMLHCALVLKPQLAHIHDSAGGVFQTIFKLFRPRMPLLGTFHGNPYERAKWSGFAKWYLRLSEWFFIHTCTELTTVARSKVEDVQARSKTPIHFIPNGVDPVSPPTGIFDFDGLGLKKNEYLMFAAGRMDPTKGLHHLLDALDMMPDVPYPLLVAGGFEGHHQDYSEKLLARCKANPNIVLVPRLLNQQELYEATAHSKIFIFPSEIEAMSMMLLEAISCGATVLASDIRENVDVTGVDYPWLFKNADPGNLAATLQKLLKEGPGPSVPQLAERIAATMNWTQIAEQYHALYTRMTAKA